QVDVDGGSVYNYATVSGYDPNSQIVESSDEETVTAIQNPVILLDKFADRADFDSPGDSIEYTFIISNDGNVTLDNVVLTDPLYNIIYGPLTLEPGEKDTSYYIYVTVQDDVDNGGIYNIATVFGDDPNDNQLSSQDDVFVTAIQNPSLELTKESNRASYQMSGDSIEYTFSVENTGNVTLTEVTIQDPLFGLFFGPVTLEPDSVHIYSYIHIVDQMNIDTGSIVNIAFASGKDPNDNTIEDTDDETVTAIQTPGIQLEKTADVLTYDSVGDQITYSFVVSNTGNVTLSNVEVNDPLYNLTFGPVTLSPSASETFTYTYTIAQVDIDNGSIYNQATVSGEDPNNSPVEDTDDETVTAIQTPGIQLEKTADVLTYDSVGDQLTYSFVVSNTGNV